MGGAALGIARLDERKDGHERLIGDARVVYKVMVPEGVHAMECQEAFIRWPVFLGLDSDMMFDARVGGSRRKIRSSLAQETL